MVDPERAIQTKSADHEKGLADVGKAF